MPTVSMDVRPRLDSLTGLRWWAALAVFFFHLRNFVSMPETLFEFAKFGNYGVAFFFMLSGFVLTWSWRESTGTGTFYWRRFARIYPLHLLTFLLALPIFYSFSRSSEHPWVKPVDWGVLLLCLLLLQGWSRDPSVTFAGNPASWTLTVEAFFYALHPFFSKALIRLRARGALLVSAGIFALSVAARTVIAMEPNGWFALLPWPVLRINEFLIGMCLAWAIREGWRLRVSVWVPVILIFGYLLGVQELDRFLHAEPVQQLLERYTNEAMLLLFALLICAVAMSDLRPNRSPVFGSRAVVILGEWSFAFYLVHATLMYLSLEVLGHRVSGWSGLAWALVLLVVSTAVAGVLHVWFERPVERVLRSWQNRQAKRHSRSDRTPSATAFSQRS